MLHAGGTRFIGVYLARQLIEAGHEVTLLTRGKKPVTAQIPDDTDQSYEAYKQAVKHIACDRTDAAALKEKLGGQGFEGELLGVTHFAIEGSDGCSPFHELAWQVESKVTVTSCQ